MFNLAFVVNQTYQRTRGHIVVLTAIVRTNLLFLPAACDMVIHRVKVLYYDKSVLASPNNDFCFNFQSTCTCSTKRLLIWVATRVAPIAKLGSRFMTNWAWGARPSQHRLQPTIQEKIMKSEFKMILWIEKLALFRAGFFFDRFSASRPSGFAETLSFLLEFLSFFSKF